MIDNFALEAWLDEFLQARTFKDASFNGLQVQGRGEINSIVTSATASLESIKKAIAMKADCLLVHHGLFWKGADMRLCGSIRNRVAAALGADLNIMAYHLPLDANFELGNNRYLCDIIGGIGTDYIESGVPQSVGMLTLLKEPTGVRELGQLLHEKLKSEIEVIGANGPDRKLQSIAVCSGSGSFVLDESRKVEFDALITGDVNEQTYHMAKEYNVAVFACGHHASEQDGIRLLGERAAKAHSLEASHLHYDLERGGITIGGRQ